MMDLINTRPYVQIIPALPSGAGLLEKIFHQTVWAKHYILDTDRWIDGSFMNPNAMFDLFGKFSCETPLQVRKRMLKYLGITKKRGAEECKILKNLWIALHMHGLSAREWADNMFQKDYPGDEIALYMLCKIYHRHCVVVTSAKLWSTLEPTGNITEDELFNTCELRFLYVEPGVFGELKTKPAMPPAPSSSMVLESATDYLQHVDLAEVNSVSRPLNLSKPAVTSKENDANSSTSLDHIEHPSPTLVNSTSINNNIVDATEFLGDNTDTMLCQTSTVNVTNKSLTDKFDPYNDAPLSGALDSLRSDGDLVLSMFLSMHTKADNLQGEMEDQTTDDNIPEFPDFSNKEKPPIKIMQECMVRLSCLTDLEIMKWQMQLKPGYSLRQRTNQIFPV